MSDIVVTINETVYPVAINVIEGAGSAPAWGGITGTITNQTDLIAELNKKQNSDIVAVKNSDYTITTENVIVCSNTSAINITLPAAASVLNKRIMVIMQSTGQVTVLPSGSDMINSLPSLLINTRYNVLEVLATSYGWIVI